MCVWAVSNSVAVAVGLVDSLNRPSGNLTGVSFVSAMLGAKRLELLCALVPQTDLIAVLVDPKNAESQNQSRGVQEAAPPHSVSKWCFSMPVARAKSIRLLRASYNAERAPYSSVVARFLAAGGIKSLPSVSVICCPLFTRRGNTPPQAVLSVTALVFRMRIGTPLSTWLDSDRPSDLPVVQPTRFELVINLNTAKALGIEVPDKLLALADEVIE